MKTNRLLQRGTVAALCILVVVVLIYLKPDKNASDVQQTIVSSGHGFLNSIESKREISTENLTPSKMIQDIIMETRKNVKNDPIVQEHLIYLKNKGLLKSTLDLSNIHQIASSMISERDTTLTKEKSDRVKLCVNNGPRERDRDRARFFGKNQYIRRNHHTYLGKDKIMIELGGNWGWDSGNFSKLFNPRYIILEPLKEYVQILEKKFQNNSQVIIYNLGLGSTNEKLMVKLEGNNACATSKFSGRNGNVPIYIAGAVDFFANLGVGIFEVDLLTMNCEGCEYEVMEVLLKTNLVSNFRNIQWGTHSTLDGLKNPIGRYCRIQELLSRTHRPTYRYKFIWESWRRKDIV